MHLADAFIQRDLQLHSGYTFPLVHVFPGNRTHNLLHNRRNALPLSHTGTLSGNALPLNHTGTLISVLNVVRANQHLNSRIKYCCNFNTGTLDQLRFLSRFLTPSPLGRRRPSVCPPKVWVWLLLLSSQFSSPSSWSSLCLTPSSVGRSLSWRPLSSTICPSASWWDFRHSLVISNMPLIMCVWLTG